MSDVTVTRSDVEVVLRLNEREALHVLGCLGHATGDTPATFSELFAALVAAGYSKKFLYAQSDETTVLP